MQRTKLPGVSMWSVWQPDRNLFFNSHAIEVEGKTILVDPLPLDDADVQQLEGRVQWIVITNRDHERDAANVARRLGAKLAASEQDAPLTGLTVDRLLRDGDEIGGATVIALEGMKSPGEIALRFERLQAVIVGDALWGEPAGSLGFPPRLGDPASAIISLRRICAQHPRHLLVGDGTPIFDRAYEAIWEFLSTRSEVYANRINLNEVTPLSYPGDPKPYQALDAELGCLVGASKLGYRLAKIPPGSSFCPSHWHTAEEELFIVWSGSVTLESPRGSFALRAGDLVAFPTGATGTHKLQNESGDACSILMLSNVSRDDVCFYPDSQKVLVGSTGLIVRTKPELDYFDGEA